MCSLEYVAHCMACRHRILAELLEQGSRSTLKIPIHTPAPLSNQQPSRVESDAIRMLGTNPGQALQHPGFYYYMAARCTEMRRERFLAALKEEVR